MTLQELKSSLQNAAPQTSLTPAVQALWHDGKGDWDRAHKTVQQHEGKADADWVHAYLHRKEGDLNNAGHWYRRANQPMSTKSLAEEWEQIAIALLGG